MYFIGDSILPSHSVIWEKKWKMMCIGTDQWMPLYTAIISTVPHRIPPSDFHHKFFFFPHHTIYAKSLFKFIYTFIFLFISVSYNSTYFYIHLCNEYSANHWFFFSVIIKFPKKIETNASKMLNLVNHQY